MTAVVPLDQPISVPDAAAVAGSQLTEFVRWCEARTGRRFAGYDAFDRFAAEEFRIFWHLFLRWSRLPNEGATDPVCTDEACERAVFFPGLRLNYAEALLDGNDHAPAVTACHADGSRERLTRRELRVRVATLAASLVRLGVKPGDHVVAIARNNAEAVLAALATAATGATFSSCAPDMGVPAILSRFAPLGPVVLFAPLRPETWDVGASVADRAAEAAAGLPHLVAIIALDDGPVPPLLGAQAAVHRLSDLVSGGGSVGTDGSDRAAAWQRHPFNHPLFVMFSSGTTGAPKAIVHGAGGALLEHAKEHRLHCDLGAGDKLLFQTSCGWMMWNWQLSALASGAELVLYDGPLEGPATYWRLVAEEGVTVFGTNAAYLQFCEQAGCRPGHAFDLSRLRAVLSTGSILYPRQYDWVRQHVRAGMPLQSISGGTDILGCFVLGNPVLPVHRGEAQCRSLGMDVRALPMGGQADAAGRPGARVGELVCANPFPSRPLGFHGDLDGARFHAAYFAANPGVWTHGDLVEATPRGGWVLHGRSDDVLNVRGIRVGTSEIYRILEGVTEVAEAIAVEQHAPGEAGGTRLVLLVVLRAGAALDGALEKRIRSELLRSGSPALVPARIAQVAALPVTFSGKRSEAAARDAVNGRPVRNLDALQNPACLDAIADHPALRPTPGTEGTQVGPADAAGQAPEGDVPLHERLRTICERALATSPIGPSDNLLQLGADSLAIVTMLLAVEAGTGRSVPLSALLAAPTLEGLASFLSDGDADGAARGADAGPRIRPVSATDVGAVCRLLEHGFVEAGIKAPEWGRLFDHGWSERDGDHGFVLVVGDEIVGFLGTIFAQRRIGDKAGRVCNFTSWYVRPEYRGWGMGLLGAAMRGDEEVTYTSFTPSPTSRAAFAALGFSELQAHRIVLPPLLHAGTLLRRRPKISFDPAVVRGLLDDGQRRVFDDHAPHDCLQLVVSDGPEQAYLVVKRRGVRKVPYSEILHCSTPALLARHLERVKLAILRRQRTVFLTADACLFPVQPRGMLATKYTCYRSQVFSAGELDKLYSELVLLPI